MRMRSRRSIDLALEITATLLSLAYTWLYLRGVFPGCYAPAFIGSLGFALLCYRKQLFAETGLHLFYVAMAVYGALGMDGFAAKTLSVSSHLLYISSGALLTFGLAGYLRRKTTSKLPLIDSFTTVFSIIATWLMVTYVHENWLYWMVVNSVAFFLYSARKMYIGALLFVVYLAMAIDGYFAIGWF